MRGVASRRALDETLVCGQPPQPRTGGKHPEHWQAAVLFFNLERLLCPFVAFVGGLSEVVVRR